MIPGNDDAIRSCKVIIEAIADVARDSAQRVPRRGGGRPARARGGRSAARPRRSAQREAEEQERREAEERARREAEEAGFSPDEPATPSGTRPGGRRRAPERPRERRTFDPDEES